MTQSEPSTAASRPKVLALVGEELGSQIQLAFRKELHLVETSDMDAGLMMIQDGALELVIADLSIPKINGPAFCQKTKSTAWTQHIPVILLIAEAYTGDHAELINQGADDCISTPIDVDLLKAKALNLIETRRQLRAPISGTSHDPDPVTNLFMVRVNAMVNANLHDPAFGVAELACLLNVNRTTLLLRVSEEVNRTPSEYIRFRRLQVALALLNEAKKSIAEIANEVGFPEPTNFTRFFKNAVGVPPSQYREESK